MRALKKKVTAELGDSYREVCTFPPANPPAPAAGAKEADAADPKGRREQHSAD